MNIYVPKHLRRLEIVNNLCEMIQKYGEGYQESTGSFDSYQTYMKIDPVKRFIGMCLSEIPIPLDQDYETVLNYITRLFYSIKGTYSVFEYMKRYLGLEFVDDFVLYTTKTISFTLVRKVGDDISLFDEYLLEFLRYLLYFESINYSIRDAMIDIRDELDFYGGPGIITYKRYIVTK